MVATKVVLIILDDVGHDLLSSTNLPHIQALRAASLRFNQCWSMPNCSPTRAAIMTGQFPFRTGLGDVIREFGDPGLSDQLPSIASVLQNVRSGFIGKWHLAELSDTNHPNRMGWDTFAGTMGNIPQDGQSYFNWTKTINGSQFPETTYNTLWLINQARRAVVNENLDLIVLGLNAPHTPLHKPPEGTYTTPLCGQPNQCADSYVRAMLESADHYLGSLLSQIDLEQTYVILMSDNGTSPNSAVNHYRAKGTVYQDGIRVPLSVAGPGIVPGDSESLISVVDIVSTIAGMFGVIVSTPDSVSFLPELQGNPQPRSWCFSQGFSPNHSTVPTTWQRAVRNLTHKLIQRSDGTMELYDLSVDPGELNPLPLWGPEFDSLSSLSSSLG